jgi:hypothetical protein
MTPELNGRTHTLTNIDAIKSKQLGIKRLAFMRLGSHVYAFAKGVCKNVRRF